MSPGTHQELQADALPLQLAEVRQQDPSMSSFTHLAGWGFVFIHLCKLCGGDFHFVGFSCCLVLFVFAFSVRL